MTRRAQYVPPVAAAILALGLYICVALARITHPFDLEWMEGGMADHVARVVAGEPLYVEPSIEFVPFVYTPFYYIVSAGAWLVTGPGLFPLRLVSFVASLACFALIALIVRRETSSNLCGLIAAGFYAACFRAGGAWLDIARNDSLFLALMLGGILALRARSDAMGAIAAAILFFLSFFTKQTALMVAAPLALWCLAFRTGWARFAFAGTLAILAGGSTLVMNGLTGGWYSWYVFGLPPGHEIDKPFVLSFWTTDLGSNVPIAAFFTALWLIIARHRKADAAFHLSLQMGLVGASWFIRMHTGGYDNVLLPVYAGVAIGLGMGLNALVERSQQAIAAWTVTAVCAAQLLWLAYDPRPQLPRAGDAEAGAGLVRLIHDLPGEVFIPGRGHLSALAGKRPFAHAIAIDDVFQGDDGEGAVALEESIRAALSARRFGALIFDEPPREHLDLLQAGYEHRGRLLSDPLALMPVTGLPTRPEELYLRRP